MKRILSSLLLFVFVLSVQGKVPYTTLDSLCTLIKAFQAETEGRAYEDPSGLCQLSFPGDHFNVLSYNRLAYHAVNKTFEHKELLYVTQNIDLSKATAVVLPRFRNGFGPIELRFPAGYLKTEVYEGGRLVSTISPDRLDFFTTNDKGGAADRKNFTYWKNYKTLAHLCHLLMLEKGMIDEAYVKKVNEQFDVFLNHNSNKSTEYELAEKTLAEFQKKTIKPLYLEEVRESYEYYKGEEDKAKRFIDSLCTLYKFKPNLSEREFGNYNAEAGDKVLYQNANSLANAPVTMYSVSSKNRQAGPSAMMVNNNIVTKYTYLLEYNSGNPSKTTEFYNALMKHLKAKVPNRYIKTFPNEQNQVYVYALGSPVVIVFEHKLVEGSSRNDKNTYVAIKFTTEETDVRWLKPKGN